MTEIERNRYIEVTADELKRLMLRQISMQRSKGLSIQSFLKRLTIRPDKGAEKVYRLFSWLLETTARSHRRTRYRGKEKLVLVRPIDDDCLASRDDVFRQRSQDCFRDVCA